MLLVAQLSNNSMHIRSKGKTMFTSVLYKTHTISSSGFFSGKSYNTRSMRLTLNMQGKVFKLDVMPLLSARESSNSIKECVEWFTAVKLLPSPSQTLTQHTNHVKSLIELFLFTFVLSNRDVICSFFFCPICVSLCFHTHQVVLK